MGLDSVELVMAIEEEFGCSISNADAERMATPRDVIDWLELADRDGRIFLKLSPHPAPAGWWVKLGHMAKNYEVKDWWSTASRPLSRDLVREKIFQIVKEQTGVEKVWEDARFVEDLRID